MNSGLQISTLIKHCYCSFDESLESLWPSAHSTYERPQSSPILSFVHVLSPYLSLCLSLFLHALFMVTPAKSILHALEMCVQN